MNAFIGLGGRLSAGKDVVADYLVEKHGWTKIGMADSFLEAALALDPIVYPTGTVAGTVRPQRFSSLYGEVGYVEAKKNPEVRRFLQVLGTEVGRNMIHENVWVNMTARRIYELFDEDKKVVLTGLRFNNEVELVRGLLGVTVWVERPGHGSATSAALHPSETSLGMHDFDFILNNSDTIEHLHKLTDTMLDIYRPRFEDTANGGAR